MGKPIKQKRRRAMALLCALLWLLPAPALGAAYEDGVYRDLAPGYNDDVIITLTVRDGKLTGLTAQNRNGNESEYFRKAEQGIAAAVLEKQGAEGVEAVSGATGTSESILQALGGALEQAGVGGDGAGGNGAGVGSDGSGGAGGNAAADGGAGGNGAGVGSDGSGGAGENAADGAGANGGAGAAGNNPSPAMTPRPTLDPAKAEVFAGLGSVANFRAGPGKDDAGVQVYSFNVAMASVLFDKDGKMLNVRADVYEVATPNYDGASMPHFSGWPGKEGYNVTDPNTGKVTGVSQQTEESLTEEISAWRTKRERGDEYGMNPKNEWYRQMDAYQQWMLGKTVAELREWFARNTSPRNGRPIQAGSEQAEDGKLLEALSPEEQKELADVVSMATMSLNDSHGLILEAIEKAYTNRTPVDGAEAE